MGAGFFYSSTDDASTARSNVLKKIDYLRQLICNVLPARFKQGDPNCLRVIKFRRCIFRSIELEQDVDSNDFNSSSEA